MRPYVAAVIGGDARSGYIASFLEAQGHRVLAIGLDHLPGRRAPETALSCAAEADLIVLPLPATLDGYAVNAPFSAAPIRLADVLGAAHPGQLLVGGKLPAPLLEAAAALGLTLRDYLERDELAILNAIPTAEGAIEIAMRETPFTLWRSRCLVIGYGRCGKALSRRLAALGAQVTATARSSADLTWIQADGLNALATSDVPARAGEFDILFGTVPAPVLGRDALAAVKEPQEKLIIDLASTAGIDLEAARAFGMKAFHALSLPGKVAPKTAAGIIAHVVGRMMEEFESSKI